VKGVSYFVARSPPKAFTPSAASWLLAPDVPERVITPLVIAGRSRRSRQIRRRLSFRAERLVGTARKSSSVTENLGNVVGARRQ